MPGCTQASSASWLKAFLDMTWLRNAPFVREEETLRWVDVLSYARSEGKAGSRYRISSLLCLFCYEALWDPLILAWGAFGCPRLRLDSGCVFPELSCLLNSVSLCDQAEE